jgi:hypothetical protein
MAQGNGASLGFGRLAIDANVYCVKYGLDAAASG